MAVDRRSSRLGMLALVAVLLLGALGTRLWFLQGVQAEEYQVAVNAAKTRTVYVPPERGRIFDADGRVLADNERILTVTVDWNVVRGRDKTRAALFERLSGPLEIPAEEMEARFKSNRYDPLLPLPLKEDVDEQTVQFLLERSEDYPGINVTEEWQRVYPYAPLAAHVVGYMGALNEDNVDEYVARGYNRNERTGTFGVEQSMESRLHGSWGSQVWEIDAAGNTVRLLESTDPIAGDDIQLTIDLDVQQYAEQTLETQLRLRRDLDPESRTNPPAHNPIDPEADVEGARVYASSKEFGEEEWIQYKAPAGSVVVLDHSNGQVIAMASYPTFDNRWFNAGISKSKFDQLFPPSEDPDKSILVNRAISGRYNLGSTIKPFIAWSAMHSGLIDADDIWEDHGTYELVSIEKDVCRSGVRCEFRNALDGNGVPSQYGPVTVEDALAVSSDTFFYRLGEGFYTLPGRRDELKADLMEFGFGADSGIDLPYEWDGRIPDDEVKADLVARGVLGKNEAPRLLVGDLVQVSIGQGLMAATPLQLANAYAALGNGGFVMRPHVVKNVYEPLTPDRSPGVADLAAGTISESFERPDITHQLEMPPEIREPIVKGLGRVVAGPGVEYPKGRPRSPTGYNLFFRAYPEDGIMLAGKTGTAQGAGNYPWNDSSVFGAFSLDATRPYTVVAYLEKSGFGARGAAPVVKCIFTALSKKTAMDPVVPSDPLDLNSYMAAPERTMPDERCLYGRFGADTVLGSD